VEKGAAIGSSAIFVHRANYDTPVSFRSRIEVTGFAGQGGFLPIVQRAHVQVIGKGELPRPREVAWERLVNGSEDCQWVAVEGVVHGVENLAQHVVLTVGAAGGHFKVYVPDATSAANLRHLIAAEVRIVGVCAVVLNDDEKPIGFKMFVQDLENVQVKRPATPNPFTLAATSISKVGQPGFREGRQIRIVGQIVDQPSTSNLLVRDSSGALLVDLAAPQEFDVGEHVEVVGFPGNSPCPRRLRNGVVRQTSQFSLPAPKPVKGSEIEAGLAQFDFISVEAVLVGIAERGNHYVLLAKSQDYVFEADFFKVGTKDMASTLVPGSLLRIAGICMPENDNSGEGRQCRIAVRGGSGIEVLESPPWWSSPHVRWVLVGSGVFAVAALTWVLSLRGQVRRQTEQVRRRLQSEAHLEARYRELFENANDVIYTLDLEGRLTSLNRAGQLLAGYTEDDLRGRSFSDIVAPGQEALTQGLLSTRPPNAAPQELTIRDKNGQAIVLEVCNRILEQNGKPIGIQGIARNVTERKQSEATRNRLTAILDATPDLVAICHVDGPVLYLNHAGREMLGLDPSEVVTLTSRQPDWARTIVSEEALPQALKDGFWSGETVFVNRTGREIPVSQVVIAHKDRAGRVEFLSTIARDTTERKRLEWQLRQAQKMEAVGRLAGGIAHDFNNLLTVINGYSELLVQNLAGAQPLTEMVQQVSLAGERAAGLTRQLLAFSRKQVLTLAPVDLNTVIREMEMMLRRLIGEDIELLVETESGLDMVMVDRGQMEQVILNLAVNARDAMPQGGHLVLATVNRRINAPASSLANGSCERFGTLLPGDYVELRVQDTGCGMDAVTLAHAFEPFYTTKEVGKGTGLGLATVYGIVEQSGGHVSVESRVGQGTTFHILLPRSSKMDDTAQAPTDVPDQRHGRETVLLVEDEEAVRNLARRVLRHGGYRVLEAANGQEALAVAERHKEPIDLLLTDVIMPRMGGRELAGRLRGTWADLRVLFTSGHANDDGLGRFVQGENASFLAKPFTSFELSRKVREVLDQGTSSSKF
jgi:PAS domain S-box-containing protein